MGVGLLVVGAVAFIAGFWLPRRFDLPVGRNRPGEIIAMVLGPLLMAVGVLLVAVGR
jgi:hypothetical protein